MILNPGKDVHLIIEGVHDGDAALVEGKLAFRPNGPNRPETATRALVDGEVVAIDNPRLSKRAGGAYEARVRS